MSSAGNLCKQIGPRSGWQNVEPDLDPKTKCRAWSGSKLFDTLMVFWKGFFWKVDFEKNHEKNQQATTEHGKLPSMQQVKSDFGYHRWPFFCFATCNEINSIGPVKQKYFAKNCDYFLIHQFKHVFWVLKRTVSSRRFFWVPTTYVLVEK